jgi:hypothetical protein
MSLQVFFGYYLLPNLPLWQGEERGISKIGMLWLFPFTAIIFVVIFYFMVRKNLLVCIKIGILAGLIFQIFFGVINQSLALVNPSYASQAVRQKIEKLVEDEKSIAGGWAPFFTAESNIPSLYMNVNQNHPENAHLTQPDFFLFSDIPNDIKSLSILESHPEVILGEPETLGAYHNHTILLIPLSYRK